MSQVGAFFSKDHHEKVVSEAKDHLNALVSQALEPAQNEKVRHVVATGRAYEEDSKSCKEHLCIADSRGCA